MWVRYWTVVSTRYTADLPLANVFHSLAERPLQTSAELQSITADLNDVVDKSTQGCQGKCRGKQDNVSKLDEHLLVILKGVLLIKAKKTTHRSHNSSYTETTYFTSASYKGFLTIHYSGPYHL